MYDQLMIYLHYVKPLCNRVVKIKYFYRLFSVLPSGIVQRNRYISKKLPVLQSFNMSDFAIFTMEHYD